MKKIILILLLLLLALAVPSFAETEVKALPGYSNGYPVPYTICMDNTSHSTGGSTAETTLATCRVPGNAPGPMGIVSCFSTWKMYNNAQTKTGRLRIAASNGTAFASTAFTTQTSGRLYTEIANVNATNVQSGITTANAGVGFSTSGSPVASAIDTTADFTLYFTGQTSLETGVQVTGVVGAAGVCTVTKASHGLLTGEYIKMSGGSNCPTSGTPNADPVAVTRVDANTFTHACDCVGTEAGTQPTFERYSPLTLQSFKCAVERAN